MTPPRMSSMAKGGSGEAVSLPHSSKGGKFGSVDLALCWLMGTNIWFVFPWVAIQPQQKSYPSSSFGTRRAAPVEVAILIKGISGDVLLSAFFTVVNSAFLVFVSLVLVSAVHECRFQFGRCAGPLSWTQFNVFVFTPNKLVDVFLGRERRVPKRCQRSPRRTRRKFAGLETSVSKPPPCFTLRLTACPGGTYSQNSSLSQPNLYQTFLAAAKPAFSSCAILSLGLRQHPATALCRSLRLQQHPATAPCAAAPCATAAAPCATLSLD